MQAALRLPRMLRMTYDIPANLWILRMQAALRLPRMLRMTSYFLTSRERPVISAGCGMPMISSSVGTISHSFPPSFRV